MTPRCTTIIVNWNTRDLLRACLQSLPRDSATGILVIDNASSDGSADMMRRHFPQLRLLANEENIGFARACNIGIREAETEFILLLNSDCRVAQTGLFQRALDDFDQDPQLAILGPRLLYPDGRVQSAGRLFLTAGRVFRDQVLFRASPFFSRGPQQLEPEAGAKPYPVDWVSGAALFARREALDKIGLLRESYVMYAEDMELCYRARRMGFGVACDPALEIIHHKSRSTRQDLARSLRYSVRNNSLFIKERQGGRQALSALVCYFFGTALRGCLAPFRRNAPAAEWFKLLVKIPAIALEVMSEHGSETVE